MSRKKISLFLASMLTVATVGFGQSASDSPRKVKFTVEKSARAETGELVLCVRIIAESGSLTLQGQAAPEKDAAADDPPPPFSLSHAYLLDTATGKKIPALAALPRKPYFGPMSVITALQKGDWIEMGVAFPFPAAPPSAPEGGAKSQLLLYLPLEAKPVPVSLPTA